MKIIIKLVVKTSSCMSCQSLRMCNIRQ